MLSTSPDKIDPQPGFTRLRWNLRSSKSDPPINIEQTYQTLDAMEHRLNDPDSLKRNRDSSPNSPDSPPPKKHHSESDEDLLGNLKGFVEYSDNHLLQQIMNHQSSDEDHIEPSERLEYLPPDIDEIDPNNDNMVSSYLAGGNPTLRRHLRQLTREERLELFQIERNIRKGIDTHIPLKLRILKLPAPPRIKIVALERYDQMERMGTENANYANYYHWIQCILSIPWDKYITQPVTNRNSPHEINNWLLRAQHLMDREIYGLHHAKISIIEALGKYISREDSTGLVLGIEGSPGVGKTVLMREGVAEAFGRPFITIPLGGARDGCYLDGSNSVYTGATYGQIVESLIQAQCMNAVFYFDELDKLSETSYGRELSNVLIHLTDPAQNHDFEDKFLGVKIDVSKAIFIFSYNDINKIDPVLRDRIRKIRIQDYTIDDKVKIVMEYAFKKILQNYGFLDTDVMIKARVVKHVITKYADHETGIRELLRCMDIIVSKINILRLLHVGFAPHAKPEKEKANKTMLAIDYDIPHFNLPYEVALRDVDNFMRTASDMAPRVYKGVRDDMVWKHNENPS